jgi:hypothetical protein
MMATGWGDDGSTPNLFAYHRKGTGPYMELLDRRRTPALRGVVEHRMTVAGVGEFSQFDPYQPDIRVGAEQVWSPDACLSRALLTAIGTAAFTS